MHKFRLTYLGVTLPNSKILRLLLTTGKKPLYFVGTANRDGTALQHL